MGVCEARSTKIFDCVWFDIGYSMCVYVYVLVCGFAGDMQYLALI